MLPPSISWCLSGPTIPIVLLAPSNTYLPMFCGIQFLMISVRISLGFLAAVYDAFNIQWLMFFRTQFLGCSLQMVQCFLCGPDSWCVPCIYHRPLTLSILRCAQHPFHVIASFFFPQDSKFTTLPPCICHSALFLIVWCFKRSFLMFFGTQFLMVPLHSPFGSNSYLPLTGISSFSLIAVWCFQHLLSDGFQDPTSWCCTCIWLSFSPQPFDDAVNTHGMVFSGPKFLMLFLNVPLAVAQFYVAFTTHFMMFFGVQFLMFPLHIPYG